MGIVHICEGRVVDILIFRDVGNVRTHDGKDGSVESLLLPVRFDIFGCLEVFVNVQGSAYVKEELRGEMFSIVISDISRWTLVKHYIFYQILGNFFWWTVFHWYCLHEFF